MRVSSKVHKVRKVAKLILALYFMHFSLLSIGQAMNKDFVKKNFKDNTKGFRKAVDSIKKGNSYYDMGAHYYRYAIPYYLSAENFNPDNAKLNCKIGKCMIYSSQKNNAAPYLIKAIKLDPTAVPEAHYYLGRALHLMMYWDSAIREYNTYLQTLTPDKSYEIADVRKKIEECNNGNKISGIPPAYFCR
jgi:tetratricopeptide (TPR) repeat protein